MLVKEEDNWELQEQDEQDGRGHSECDYVEEKGTEHCQRLGCMGCRVRVRGSVFARSEEQTILNMLGTVSPLMSIARIPIEKEQTHLCR